MDVTTYIKQCVGKYIQMSTHENDDLIVFVSQANQNKHWIVQIGHIIYIPNSEDIPFNGVFIRTSDSVEGWESFDEKGITIPHVTQIRVQRKGKVGPYFYVNRMVLAELLDLNKAEIYGDYRISPVSHFDVWDEKYEGIYKKPFDYYPRGRVVYRFRDAKFIVYADQCIDENGILEILKTYDIKNQNYTIDRTDEHYVCKNCNPDYYE